MLRKMPYPFKAALSISSDPDFLSFEFFETLYEFLNTKNTTCLGTGLNLEITAGLFFYTLNDYNFSYFTSDDFKKRSEFANRLDEYMSHGWVDTNHAFGDFDFHGGFTRDMATRAYDALAENDLSLPIFTNHGDANNSQNVGKAYPNYRGDDKNDIAFHSDLFGQVNTEFVWTQRMALETPGSSAVLTQEPLKHSSNLLGFNRLRATKYHAPNLNSLAYQLSLVDFQRLYKQQQAIVLYQHLGVLTRYAKYCVSCDIDAIKKNQYLLAPFYKLAEEAQKGNLWVCGTGKLLKYLKMLDAIVISELSYNTFTIESPLDVDLSGLTIYADTRDKVHLYYNNKPLPLRYNGIDETGKYSVTVPTEKSESIW